MWFTVGANLELNFNTNVVFKKEQQQITNLWTHQFSFRVSF
jgi:hypothetical protein